MLEDLIGKTLISVQEEDDSVVFRTTDNCVYIMEHEQDWCESVHLEDVTGELTDIIGSPILVADERSETMSYEDAGGDSGTWTFYEFRTVRASITLRWGGYSNGYYSESVNFYERFNP